MERACSTLVFFDLTDDSGVFRGCGLLRIFRTVEAERKILRSLSWLDILTLPQLMLFFVISQMSEAISIGVLFAGILDGVCSSILCSHR